MKEINKQLKVCTWTDVRTILSEILPQFSKIIDEISPSPKYKLYIATYNYGEMIIDKGEVKLPTDNGIKPISSENIPQTIQDDLSYSPAVPMGIPLDKSLELFFTPADACLPCQLLKQGHIFATTGLINPEFSYDAGTIWNISAGARSTFLLNRIGNNRRHIDLIKDYGVTCQAPKHLLDHFFVFRELENQLNEDDKWTVDVLFFGSEWFKTSEDDRWAKFWRYLLSHAWKITVYLRHMFKQEAIVSKLLAIAAEKDNQKKIKPSANELKTINHIIGIASSNYPGFSVANDSNLVPLETIQEAYMESYNIDDYIPTIMQPAYLSQESPIYYSLQFPSLLDFSPKGNKLSSKIDDIRSLMSLFESLREEINTEQVGIFDKKFPLYTLSELANLRFFHTEKDAWRKLEHLTANTVSTLNDSKINDQIKQYPQKNICMNSPFLQGLIQISIKSL